jgi:signal transduction histidine kinase
LTLTTSTKIIPVIVISSVVIVTIIAFAFAQAQVERSYSEVLQSKQLKLELIVNSLELRIEDATKMLKQAATQNEVKNVMYASSVNEEFMGIPPDTDEAKRLAAQNIRTIYQDFETVAFILPNGDIYFVEPYEAQKNLPRLNFAFREWYQGVISNGDTHIGEAVVSAATGHRVVPIAVAVYSENKDNHALTGILVGALDMNVVERELREGELGRNEYILIADNKGTIVADSREGSIPSNLLQSALNVEDVNKALEGDFGSSAQTIDGADMFIAYRPIHVGTSIWAIASLQPHEDAFFTVNTITYQSILTIILVSIVSSISGYLLYRSFQGNNTLTRRLKHLNEDLKKQAQRLVEVDKEKEEFSAMITHELKTPLVPIIGYSELLLDGTLGELSQKQKEKMTVLHESATSLSSLISDLLDIRKVELGKLKLETSEVSARELIEKSISALRPLAEAKNMLLSSRLEYEDLKLICDPKRIQQVIYNLLTNAIKFTPTTGEGRIEISARELDKHHEAYTDGQGSLLFSVKDNGMGIPKDKQQHLFKKFYQVDTSLTRNVGGSGLGLAISKGIVDAHNGKIWLESEEGKGSIVYFILPKYEQIRSDDNNNPLHAATIQSSGNKRKGVID